MEESLTDKDFRSWTICPSSAISQLCNLNTPNTLCIQFFIYKYNHYSSRRPAVKPVDKAKLTSLDVAAVEETVTKS